MKTVNARDCVAITTRAPAMSDGSAAVTTTSTVPVVLNVSAAAAVYVPGHGAVVDAEFVRRQRDWLAGRSEAGGTP